MFVEYIYIYEQYNPETTRRNTPKLKHFIPIEKIKHLSKRNWQSWFEKVLPSNYFKYLIFGPIYFGWLNSESLLFFFGQAFCRVDIF